MTDADNLRRARHLRELVALRFQIAGVEEARPRHPRPGRRLSEALAEAMDSPPGHVTGLPSNWLVIVGADVHERRAERLDAAEHDREIAGATYAAVVGYRRNASLDDYPVSMTLRTLALLVARDAQLSVVTS